MGLRRFGAVLALFVLMTACNDGGTVDESSKQSETPSPTVTTDPGPSIEAQLKRLAKDALAIDRRAEVVEASGDVETYVDHMYWEHSQEAGYGDMYMEAALTVVYPGLDGRERARDFLALFKKHGFGTDIGYRVDDIVHGTVQRSTDLRCRALLDDDEAMLSCIPNEFFDFMEWDVVNAITSLYADETDSVDIGGWEVIYPQGYDAEPPVGAILRTNVDSEHLELRAYVGTPDGWQLVAHARSYFDLGRALGREVCASDMREAFWLVCPRSTA